MCDESQLPIMKMQVCSNADNEDVEDDDVDVHIDHLIYGTCTLDLVDAHSRLGSSSLVKKVVANHQQAQIMVTWLANVLKADCDI